MRTLGYWFRSVLFRDVHRTMGMYVRMTVFVYPTGRKSVLVGIIRKEGG